ncbi:MAG: hypothetical protein JXX28_12190 [Deltaproteobacteria bacterium]|nr:hypothetical protein [Deltaproteobacteria bacterium]
MTRYDAEVRTTFTLPHPPETVLAHFASLEVIAAATADVERYQAHEDGRLAFDFKEQNLGVAKFKGQYTARYAVEGDTLTWSTLTEEPHNSGTEGEATFKAVAEGTEVSYREAVFFEVEVPAMVAGMLKPAMVKGLESTVNTYLKKVKGALG